MNLDVSLIRQRDARRPPIALAVFLGLLATGTLIAWLFFGSLSMSLRYLRGERLIVRSSPLYADRLSVGVPAEVATEVWNYTPRTVALLGTSGSCTCVVAQGLPTTIPAGSDGQLRFTVRTLPGKEQIDETITVFTDSPAHPQLRIRVKGAARE